MHNNCSVLFTPGQKKNWTKDDGKNAWRKERERERAREGHTKMKELRIFGWLFYWRAASDIASVCLCGLHLPMQIHAVVLVYLPASVFVSDFSKSLCFNRLVCMKCLYETFFNTKLARIEKKNMNEYCKNSICLTKLKHACILWRRFL